ncbi:Protein phosphatase 2C-like protein [Colletotrichum chlorophyti]|uniref:Protein phosphatase 2C-like protein n=1 Tax=Colletotrichum chlorophyti TaxID=708187 RepID=A0A1Q8S8R4_9PEZI|nr:Protein phosphatase 2C-like protein [Colletotrichum chlorophyti]
MLHRAYRPSIGAALRLPARSVRTRTTALRFYSTAGPSKASRTPQLIGLAAVSAVAGWCIASFRKDGSQPTGAIPQLGSGPVDLDAVVKTPVDAGSFEEADAKLRHDVFTGTFAAEGKNAYVYAARVASNHPVEDNMQCAKAPGIGGADSLFNGVYDGHAGWATSVLLKAALVPAVSEYTRKLGRDAPDAAVDAAITRAFTDVDGIIMNKAEKAVEALKLGAVEPGDHGVIAALAPAIAGSCALLSVFDPPTSTLRVACTGDSRAVLGIIPAGSTSYSAVELSKDQNGRNQDEYDRITKEHPGEEGMIDPKSGRLFGIAVTRAFGDHRWKWTSEFINQIHLDFFGTAPRPKAVSPPYMTAAPVVTTTKIHGPDFVILASDGLWDHISSEDAVECVSQWLAAKKAGVRSPADKLAHTPAMPSKFAVDSGWPNWHATPEYFVVEDLDNAAVHLIKNAFGGRRRTLFTGVTLAYPPLARTVRDDTTVQVIFFQDPTKK